jgi:hypothetical protein
MTEKIAAMEKGRSLLAKRVEELTAANEESRKEEPTHRVTELEADVARLQAKADDERTVQVWGAGSRNGLPFVMANTRLQGHCVVHIRVPQNEGPVSYITANQRQLSYPDGARGPGQGA